jgi:hypothetical protein
MLGGFNRTSWDDQGLLLDQSDIGLLITSGRGRGRKLSTFDPTIPFYAPYALNRVDPGRMLLGTCFIYESFDRGDTLTNLGSVGTNPAAGTACPNAVSAIAYGGRSGGVPQPPSLLCSHRRRSIGAGRRRAAYASGGGPGLGRFSAKHPRFYFSPDRLRRRIREAGLLSGRSGTQHGDGPGEL